MRSSRLRTAYALGMAAILFAHPLQAQPSLSMKDRVDRIIAAFPAKDAAGRDSLANEILRLGPKAVDLLFRRILPSDRSEGVPTRYAANALVLHAGRPDAENDRLVVVKSLSHALASGKNIDVMAFLVEQLRFLGKDESVKVLRKFVRHSDLGDPAVRALSTIGSASAQKALLKSLSKTRGRNHLAVVQALGDLKSLPAVPKLIPLASSNDSTLRICALEALAKIGDARAEPLFTNRLEQNLENGKSASLALEFASSLAAREQKEKAVRIGMTVLDRTGMTGSSACAALDLLVSVLKDSAMDDLLRASESPDPAVRNQALSLADRIPGIWATSCWIDKLGSGSAPARAGIVAMLGARGDSTALPALVQSLNDPDSTVFEAAVPAAARLGSDRVFCDELEILKRGGSKEASLVEQAFLCYFGAPSLLELFANFETLSPASKTAAFRIASARRAGFVFDAALAQVSNPDTGIARAAARSLPYLAGEEHVSALIRKLSGQKDPIVLALLQQSLAVAVLNIPDPDLRTERILNDPSAGSGDDLVPVLPRIGGTTALEFLVGRAQNRNPEIRRAAISALSGWPDADAAFVLFSLFRNSPFPDSRCEALSGWIGLAEHTGFSPLQKLEGIRDGLAATKSVEEMKILLDGLSTIRTQEAFFLAASLLGNVSVQEQSIGTMADITCPAGNSDPGLKSPEVLAILERAESMVQDESIRGRIRAHLSSSDWNSWVFNQPPDGFSSLFKGKNLDGWKGLVSDPLSRARMALDTLHKKQEAADASMNAHWTAKDGVLEFDGKGESLCTADDYEDFELLVDWKIEPGGDSGIYLRGSPQVQIWDPATHPEGSGGLYNNQVHPRDPMVRADRPAGVWNTFRILMEDDRVTVYLNGILVADRVVMENYWDRTVPIFRKGQIELQNHGNQLHFRNVFIRPVLSRPAWKSLFNGRDLFGWVGDVSGYKAENNVLVCPETGGGNLYTAGEYGDFAFRFEFRLLSASNNGVGLRTPLSGDAAYEGMEIQILDDSAPVYAELQPYQYHGSVYGVVPSRRGFQKPVGEWNEEIVAVDGRRVSVFLNGIPIVDADLDKASSPETMDGRDHPGLKRVKGHIGFLGHGSRVEFRNILVQDKRPCRVSVAGTDGPASKKGYAKRTSGGSER